MKPLILSAAALALTLTGLAHSGTALLWPQYEVLFQSRNPYNPRQSIQLVRDSFALHDHTLIRIHHGLDAATIHTMRTMSPGRTSATWTPDNQTCLVTCDADRSGHFVTACYHFTQSTTVAVPPSDPEHQSFCRASAPLSISPHAPTTPTPANVRK